MWYLIECSGDGTGENPEPWSSLFTLGCDPEKKAFVGTFIGSMMAQLWIYEGHLDAAGKCVTWDAKFRGLMAAAGRCIATALRS